MSNTFKSKNKINVIHMLIIPIINPAFPSLSFCLKLNHPNTIESIPNITDITINCKKSTDKIEKTSDVIPNPLPECILLFSSTLKSPPIYAIIAQYCKKYNSGKNKIVIDIFRLKHYNKKYQVK